MMGPLISAIQPDKVETLIATDQGAQITYGGGNPLYEVISLRKQRHRSLFSPPVLLKRK